MATLLLGKDCFDTGAVPGNEDNGTTIFPAMHRMATNVITIYPPVLLQRVFDVYETPIESAEDWNDDWRGFVRIYGTR